MTVRIGTSGWVYSHWRGIVYPAELPPRDRFAAYAQLFDTVEINNSFYRLPSAATFAAWRDQAPPGFLYAVKASRFLTHMKKLNEPDEPLRRFFERAEQLRPALGPVLEQLPPHWHLNLDRFANFLAALPKGYQHVVEFRDASWLIEQHRVAHCLHDMRPLTILLRLTAPTVYVRFHGDVAHGGDYPHATLERWAERIAGWRGEGREVYVYFNNDIGAYAVRNAQTLRQLLGR